MKPRHKRFVFVGLALVGVVAAGGLVNKALQSNISYYFSPTQVAANEAPKDEVFRVGGLVRTGTLQQLSFFLFSVVLKIEFVREALMEHVARGLSQEIDV